MDRTRLQRTTTYHSQWAPTLDAKEREPLLSTEQWRLVTGRKALGIAYPPIARETRIRPAWATISQTCFLARLKTITCKLRPVPAD